MDVIFPKGPPTLGCHRTAQAFGADAALYQAMQWKTIVNVPTADLKLPRIVKPYASAGTEQAIQCVGTDITLTDITLTVLKLFDNVPSRTY